MRVRQFRFYPSIHGLVLLLLHVYLLVGPVLQENDLVASALVACFGIVFFAAMIATLWCGLVARKSIRFAINPVASIGCDKFFAGEPCLIDVSTFTKLIPGIHVNVSLDSHLPNAPIIECLYSENSTTISRATTIFPHRGNWIIDIAKVHFSDRLGLWVFSIEFELEEQKAGLLVYPVQQDSTQYPSIQSTEREGDTSISTSQSSGDLYDIKRYHPSDGMRKIVWKVFARTGELLSRHPEPTMTPEGKSVIFACGGSFHDSAYSAAAEYAQLRQQEGYEVLLGGSTLATDHGYRSCDQFMLSAIESSFNPPTAEALSNLISAAKEEGGLLRQIAIFVDFDNDVDESIRLALEAVKVVQNTGLVPVIMSVSQKSLSEILTVNPKSNFSIKKLKNIFVEQEYLSTSQNNTDRIVQFVQYCENQQWPVV